MIKSYYNRYLIYTKLKFFFLIFDIAKQDEDYLFEKMLSFIKIYKKIF